MFFICLAVWASCFSHFECSRRFWADARLSVFNLFGAYFCFCAFSSSNIWLANMGRSVIWSLQLLRDVLHSCEKPVSARCHNHTIAYNIHQYTRLLLRGKSKMQGCKIYFQFSTILTLSMKAAQLLLSWTKRVFLAVELSNVCFPAKLFVASFR